MAKQTFSSGQVLTAAQMNSLQANDYNWTVDTKTVSYVLVADDAGKRIVMNATGATTITVNTSVFTAGDVVWIHNINSGTCTVTAGTATVNTASSLALAQWEGGALYFTSASSAIFFRSGSAYGIGTGGTTLSSPPTGYAGVAFTSSGTFTVTRAGLFEVLVCAGGGGGGGCRGNGDSSASAGGGGAGGILESTIYLSTNATITIGAGGSGGAGNSAFGSPIGSSSSIGGARGIAVAGGGRGCDIALTPALIPNAGGSGGGGMNSTTTSLRTGAVSMAPDVSGKAGGDGVNSLTGGQGGGGGGGATAVGGNAATTTGGAGGAGYDVSAFIGGSALVKCAGGGGGGTTGGAGGSSGIGGAGGSNANGTSAAANTASGGGGGGAVTTSDTRNGGNGGSGIVYIRWKV